MSRIPENENLARQANQDYRNQQTTSYRAAQADIGQFGKNVNTLSKGGQVGADPFLSAGYLANQNRLTSYATEGENAAGKQTLEDQNRRAGGQNTGATQATIADLARGKMRFGNELNAQRSAGDYGRNLDYQQYLAGAPLQAAGAESGLYGTSTAGRSANMADLTKYGLNQQNQWYDILNKGISAAQAAAKAGYGALTGGG